RVGCRGRLALLLGLLVLHAGRAGAGEEGESGGEEAGQGGLVRVDEGVGAVGTALSLSRARGPAGSPLLPPPPRWRGRRRCRWGNGRSAAPAPPQAPPPPHRPDPGARDSRGHRREPPPPPRRCGRRGSWSAPWRGCSPARASRPPPSRRARGGGRGRRGA